MQDLHGATAEQRIEALRQVLANTPAPQKRPEYCNNHVHTIYSFSPYSPTEAVYTAWLAGLDTVGIMDHDSVAGAIEFKKAGKVAEMGVTVGAECRVSIANSALAGRFINNPDQKDVIYMALHGIPEKSLGAVERFFAPINEARGRRNRAMTEKINTLTEPHGIVLDYDNDVVAISMSATGGSVTERHLLYALASKAYEKFGANGCADFAKAIGCTLTDAQAEVIASDPDDLLYRLLGVFKASLVSKIYIDATDELPHITDLVKLCDEHGIILAYPYLGDIEQSVTGDKKAQKFEDEFLDLLFDELKKFGVRAVTYMPARNTSQQLERVQQLCRKNNMFEISGEDINMPSQSFICEKLTSPQFTHLVDSTYALIGHEKAAEQEGSLGMAECDFANLDEVVKQFKGIALAEI